MKLEVRNFKGCSTADITMAPFALIGGPNAAGKSSTCQALQCLLTGQTIPNVRPGTNGLSHAVAKSEAEKFVNDGASSGTAQVVDKDGGTTVNWPDMKVESNGKRPKSSILCSGMTDLNGTWVWWQLDRKQKASMLGKIIKAEPTQDMFFEAMKEAGAKQATYEKLWDAVEEQGWEAVWTTMKEHGTKTKGKWEQVTGVKYGIAKAGKWAPTNMLDSVINSERDVLEREVEAAQKVFEGAVGGEAMDQSRREQLARTATAEQPDIKALEGAVARGNKTLAELLQEKSRAGSPVDMDGAVPCPECEAMLVKTEDGPMGWGLKVATPLTEEERAARTAVHEKLAPKIVAAQETLDAASQALQDGIKAVEATANAQKELDGVMEGESKGPSKAAAQENLDDANKQLAEYDAYHEARKIHGQAERNLKIVKLLAPEGLRATALKDALGTMNGRLAEWSKVAGWSPVRLDEDFEAWFGDRPYFLFSGSEKFRAQVTLQVAMAELDGSEVVVFDWADVLDNPGRIGLFNMLQKTNLKALIGMTFLGEDKMPHKHLKDVAALYWAAGGTVREAQAS